MKKGSFIVLMIVFSLTALGEPLKLDLEEAIKLAYENSYTLKNANIDLRNSNLQVKEAYKEALPKIDYTGRADRNGDEIYGDNIDKSNTQYDHSIDLVQPLYRGGTIRAGIDAAENINQKSIYEFENQRDNLRLEVIRKYIRILELYESKFVYEKSLKEVEEQYNRANRKYELKLLAKSDILPFKTRVINNRTRIIEVVNQIKIAEVELKNEMGVDRNVDIALKNIDNKRYDLELIDLEGDIRLAREDNRDAKIAGLDVKIAESEKAVAKSEFYPKADLRFGYTSDDRNFSDSGDDWNWNAGVTVSMNLFSFGQDLNAYERSENNVRKSQNVEAKVKDDIEVQVRSYYLNLVKLEGTVLEQMSAVESAQENLNLERKRYENGLTDVIDFLTIENSLREAELELIQAQLNYYLSYEEYKDSLR